MRITRTTLAVPCIVLAVAVSGCTKEAEIPEEHATAELSAEPSEHASEVEASGSENTGEHSAERSGEHGREGSGEHGGEHSGEHGGEHSGEGGEESGTEYALNQTYDSVRNGVRLVLSYDLQTNSFIGTVENTTERTLERVRVEVHLSNGSELSPTTPIDLKPGEKSPVRLPAGSTDFEKWTAHPEVGQTISRSDVV
jgi:hypothetical protein